MNWGQWKCESSSTHDLLWFVITCHNLSHFVLIHHDLLWLMYIKVVHVVAICWKLGTRFLIAHESWIVLFCISKFRKVVWMILFNFHILYTNGCKHFSFVTSIPVSVLFRLPCRRSWKKLRREDKCEETSKCENVQEYARTCDNVRKCARACDNVRECAILCENTRFGTIHSMIKILIF